MVRHAPSIGLGLGLSLRGYGGSVSLGLLDLYPATAAYSAYDLGNKRGAVTEAEGGTRYVVSGAGTAAVNGEYVENGLSANGNKAYTLYSNGAVAFNMWSYSSTGWWITSSAVDSSPVFEDIYYEELTASTTPPALLSAAFSGALPTPTVASLTTRTVYNPVQRWRRSSDDALQMFTANDIASGTALDFVVPTDVQDLYNSAMYFDGVNDYVSIPPSSFNPTLDSQIVTFNAVPLANSVAGVIFSYRSAGTELIQVTQQDATTLLIQVRGSTGLIEQDTITVISGAKISGTLTFNGVTKTATLVTNQGSASVSGFGNVSAQSNLTLGATFSPTLSAFFKGTVYDVNINGTSAYDGDGNTNSNWLDTIGSNNGTVAGSPALFTGQGFDAYLLTEYDQSGNDYDLTQTTAANQPLVVSGGVWVDATFDGVDDQLPMTGAGLDMFRDVGYGQVFAVATSNETGLTTGAIFRLGNNAGPTRYSLGESNVTNGSYRIGGRRLDSNSFDSTTASTPHGTTQKIVTGFLNYADGEAYLYQNGVNVGTDLSFQTAGNTSNTSSGNGDMGGPSFNGKISAVVVYNTDQTANRAAIEAKLNTIIPTY